MIQVSNSRSTIGKYRNLTGADWNAILEQIGTGVLFASIEASSNNRRVIFTRTEVEYLEQKYGKAVGA
jgi:hypothetical protein